MLAKFHIGSHSSHNKQSYNIRRLKFLGVLLTNPRNKNIIIRTDEADAFSTIDIYTEFIDFQLVGEEWQNVLGVTSRLYLALKISEIKSVDQDPN